VHIRRIKGGVRQQDDPAVAADIRESRLPALRRPVIAAAMDQERQCAFVHRDALALRDPPHIADRAAAQTVRSEQIRASPAQGANRRAQIDANFLRTPVG
jgi:hypothetical protein